METIVKGGLLHAKTMKDIDEFGPKEIFRRRTAFARIAARNSSPLAEGLRKEAETIALNFGLKT